MKQFEIAGRSLTRQEQKMINGGTGETCPAGLTRYRCDVTLIDGTHREEYVCETSEQRARVASKHLYFDTMDDVTCAVV